MIEPGLPAGDHRAGGMDRQKIGAPEVDAHDGVVILDRGVKGGAVAGEASRVQHDVEGLAGKRGLDFVKVGLIEGHGFARAAARFDLGHGFRQFFGAPGGGDHMGASLAKGQGAGLPDP